MATMKRDIGAIESVAKAIEVRRGQRYAELIVLCDWLSQYNTIFIIDQLLSNVLMNASINQ